MAIVSMYIFNLKICGVYIYESLLFITPFLHMRECVRECEFVCACTWITSRYAAIKRK